MRGARRLLGAPALLFERAFEQRPLRRGEGGEA
jgi:hypothetical protein